MFAETIKTRVAHPFAHFAKGWGIARSTTALFLTSTAIPAAHAMNTPCGVTQPPASERKFFPPIAQAAHVSGQVVLLAKFDQQGDAQVSKVLSGSDMLKDAATAYIESSKAEKPDGDRECTIVVSFNLDSASCDPPQPVKPFAQIDPQHIEIYGRAPMLCDPAGTTSTRHHLLFFHWTTTS